MTRHKVHETFEVASSKDSTWQEWFYEEEIFYDDKTDEITLVKSKSFDNARRPSENWKKIISKENILLEAAPEEAQIKIKQLKKQSSQ